MDMEIEQDELQSTTITKLQLQESFKRKDPAVVVVDDAHPFDLDAYISQYSGRTAVDRLTHIISLCPSIAPQAFALAAQHVQQGRDPSLYPTIISAYETTYQNAQTSGLTLPTWQEIAPLDQKWVDETTARNQAERSKLEVELKTYSNNMIKESIRMAHRDLGDYHRATGDQASAMKHYTKSREFCTTAQHVLDMSLSALDLLVERRNYAHIATYVYKAEAALDSAHAADKDKKGPELTTTPAAATAAASKRSADRERAQTRLDYATGLSRLGAAHYERAAQSFLRLGPPASLGAWAGTLLAPADIAVYGTLCALATLSRAALRAQVLDNDNFGVYIEQEPYVRELLEAWMASRFKHVLDLLERYSTRHALDPHLAPHITQLTTLIRNRALVLFFQPFASIRLERIGAAFGWTVDEAEREAVALIQANEIQARVDSQNKILKAKEIDQRAALYSRAMQASADMQNASRKLLLRLKLHQADLLIKPPKGQHGFAHDIVDMQ